jgi:hypothetical protein
MAAVVIEQRPLVRDHQPEADLADLWLELARDLIEHARITRQWLGSDSRSAHKSGNATDSPCLPRQSFFGAGATFPARVERGHRRDLDLAGKPSLLLPA